MKLNNKTYNNVQNNVSQFDNKNNKNNKNNFYNFNNNLNNINIKNTINKKIRSLENMVDEKTKKINLELSEKTHKKLKIICTAKGMKLNEYVVSVIEKDIYDTDFNKLIEDELGD